MNQRLLNVLIAFDRFVFSLITLGKASPDETISAACYRLEQEGKLQGLLFRPLIDSLFFFNKQHCESSFESEVKGVHLGKIYYRIRKEG